MSRSPDFGPRGPITRRRFLAGVAGITGLGAVAAATGKVSYGEAAPTPTNPNKLRSAEAAKTLTDFTPLKLETYGPNNDLFVFITDPVTNEHIIGTGQPTLTSDGKLSVPSIIRTPNFNAVAASRGDDPHAWAMVGGTFNNGILKYNDMNGVMQTIGKTGVTFTNVEVCPAGDLMYVYEQSSAGLRVLQVDRAKGVNGGIVELPVSGDGGALLWPSKLNQVSDTVCSGVATTSFTNGFLKLTYDKANGIRSVNEGASAGRSSGELTPLSNGNVQVLDNDKDGIAPNNPNALVGTIETVDNNGNVISSFQIDQSKCNLPSSNISVGVDRVAADNTSGYIGASFFNNDGTHQARLVKYNPAIPSQQDQISTTDPLWTVSRTGGPISDMLIIQGKVIVGLRGASDSQYNGYFVIDPATKAYTKLEVIVGGRTALPFDPKKAA